MSDNIYDSILDLEREIWKDIPEYEGYYKLSNYGRIKGFKDYTFKKNNCNYIRIIKPYIDRQSGFLRFRVIKDKKRKSIILHTMVAKLFIPNPENYILVLHKNEDRFDNNSMNLIWCGKKKEDFNNIDGEVWKDIKGYEGLYKISNFGRVYSIKRYNFNNQKRGSYQTGRIIFQRTNNGYKNVKLIKDSKEKSFRVHRLVAENFIENPENKPFVNHKDFNRSNNNVYNLEWVTASENTKHATNDVDRHKNIMFDNNEKFTIEDILNIKNLLRIKSYSISDVATIYKTSTKSIEYINN